MSSTTTAGEQRVFLGDVRWETFEALLDDLGEPRGRLAYDQGLLEIMSPSYDHESVAGLLGQFIRVIAEALALPIRAARSTTLKRVDQQRAVEADESFYVGEHARGPRPIDIDLLRDPPPDLVVEVDLSRSSRARLRIYASLGVPEVWQWSRDRLSVLHLESNGAYAMTATSQFFPIETMASIEALVHRRRETDDTELVRELREQLRRLGRS
ncbi:MAG: Uma2 family endonuclease [Planctomycetota bacterium]